MVWNPGLRRGTGKGGVDRCDRHTVYYALGVVNFRVEGIAYLDGFFIHQGNELLEVRECKRACHQLVSYPVIAPLESTYPNRRKRHKATRETARHTVQNLAVYPMVLSIQEDKAPPHKWEYQPAVPSRLHEGIAVRLEHRLVCLRADDQRSIAVEEGEVADHVGLGPFLDPGRVGLDRGTGVELAECLAEKEMVVLKGISHRNGEQRWQSNGGVRDYRVERLENGHTLGPGSFRRPLRK